MILVRVETSPEDIHGMHAAEGILTARGGMTSHAAVVARGMGRPCVSGAGAALDRRKAAPCGSAATLKEGDVITLDGCNGQVMEGEVAMIEPELAGDFGTLMDWADEHRRMKVRTNAETPQDCQTARQFGAEGIGLCRTEHMFFDADRISAVREMILAEDEEGRRAALDKLLPDAARDFREIFTIMDGLPVHDPAARPAAARIPAAHDEEIAEVAAATGLRSSICAARRRAARVQPDARPPRLPAGHHLSRRSTRCRRGRSSRRPSRSPRKPAQRSSPRS